jgi:peptidoglycan hydrolase CwlO-like protein
MKNLNEKKNNIEIVISKKYNQIREINIKLKEISNNIDKKNTHIKKEIDKVKKTKSDLFN